LPNIDYLTKFYSLQIVFYLLFLFEFQIVMYHWRCFYF